MKPKQIFWSVIGFVALLCGVIFAGVAFANQQKHQAAIQASSDKAKAKSLSKAASHNSAVNVSKQVLARDKANRKASSEADVKASLAARASSEVRASSVANKKSEARVSKEMVAAASAKTRHQVKTTSKKTESKSQSVAKANQPESKNRTNKAKSEKVTKKAVKVSSVTKKASIGSKKTATPTSQVKAASQVPNQDTKQSVKQTATAKTMVKAPLTKKQKDKVNQAFYQWAAKRAVKKDLAISDWYFDDQGKVGKGDWYAKIPHGKLQVKNENRPGSAAFKQHAVGGVVLYTAKNHKLGKQDLHHLTNVKENYAKVMDFNQPVTKLVLGDDGVVYELTFTVGEPVSTTSGFVEENTDGQKNQDAVQTFQISKDTHATAELKKLIEKQK